MESDVARVLLLKEIFRAGKTKREGRSGMQQQWFLARGGQPIHGLWQGVGNPFTIFDEGWDGTMAVYGEDRGCNDAVSDDSEVRREARSEEEKLSSRPAIGGVEAIRLMEMVVATPPPSFSSPPSPSPSSPCSPFPPSPVVKDGL